MWIRPPKVSILMGSLAPLLRLDCGYHPWGESQFDWNRSAITHLLSKLSLKIILSNLFCRRF